MKETEIAAAVKEFLLMQHWEVWEEVYWKGQIADIVAVKHNIIWIIETKTSFGLKVIDQARRWPVHYRSVAVPIKSGFFETQRNYGIEAEIAKHFKVGILEYSPIKNAVEEVVFPPLMREYYRYFSTWLKTLENYPKQFKEAGTNGGGYYTPYKQTMESVKQIIKRHPGIDLAELIKKLDGRHHYTSIKTSLVPALRSFEGDWCEIRKDGNKNRFYIREVGKESLE
jgi:hypothetical protein